MERNALKTTFASPGGAGEQCSAALEVLRAALICPPLKPTDTDGILPLLFEDGYVHMLPSFFNLVTILTERKTDFQIVFRTFGVDIERVANELNLFCEGLHPFSSAALLDGRQTGKPDLRLAFPARACVLTRCHGEDGAYLSYTDGGTVWWYGIIVESIAF